MLMKKIVRINIFSRLYLPLKSAVVVSLKTPLPGMKVRIDGRTFVNYAEYAEGFSVPKNIAEKAGIPFKEFMAMDSMILNFT
jgi:hypothetical protein